MYERHENFRHNLLLRLPNLFPGKLRTQNRMPLDKPLPGSLQPTGVDDFRQMNHKLLDIDTGMGNPQVMEQHPLLHRRKCK